jgi:hypothetical protein
MGNLSSSSVCWNSKNCSTLHIQLVGSSTPLYLGKSILANFGLYEFRCPLVFFFFLERFPAVESSPESLLCKSSIDAANFFVYSDEAFMKFSNVFCKLENCCSMRSILVSAIGKECGSNTKLLHECITDLVTRVETGKEARSCFLFFPIFAN